MDCCPILLPVEMVKVSTIPIAQLRKDMILEQAVVGGASQSLVSVELQTKCTIPLESAEHHKMGRVGWIVHIEMVRLSTMHRVM